MTIKKKKQFFKLFAEKCYVLYNVALCHNLSFVQISQNLNQKIRVFPV